MSAALPPASGLRWTPLAFLLLVAGAALLVGAVALRSPVPLFLALPLLLAGPAAAFGGPRGPPALRLERALSGSLMTVVLEGRAEVDERTDPLDLEISLRDPEGLTPTAPPTIRRTDRSLEFEFRWQAREPTITLIPSPRIVWRDAAGLVERSAEFAAAPLVAERHPPEIVRIGAVRLRRTLTTPGETRSHRLGATGEFYGIREAAPGDPSRHINWRASGRAGRLLANEYLLDRTGDVLLLLDARRTSLGPAVDERLLALSRAAAAGIAASFLREKSRVGVGLFGEFLSVVPLGSGRAQEMRVRSQLLEARLGPTGVPSERGAVAVSRYFPPGLTTILFSTLADDSSVDLVRHLRRRGYPTIVLSPSSIPLEAERGTLIAEDEALALRILRLARRTQVNRTWEEAPTVDWEDYWSLERFIEILRRPATRRLG